MRLLAMAKVHILGLTPKPTFSFYDIMESIFFKKLKKKKRPEPFLKNPICEEISYMR